MVSRFECSSETFKKIDDFSKADEEFKTAWDTFEQKYSMELEYLDKLREERNVKLEVAKKALREEVGEADITKIKSAKAGPFVAQKKWQSYYAPEKLLARLRDKGLLEAALNQKIVVKRIDTGNFEVVKQFLQDYEIDKEFEDCEDGREMTIAIYGPKAIAPLGTEQKNE
jgi:hypothetical protein